MQRSHRSTGFALAATVLLVASARAGEIRGRLLVGDHAGVGLTLTAVPFEEPEAEARRIARKAPSPPALATTTTRADGTFAIAVSAAPGVTFRVLVEGGGAVPAWVGGTYDAAESDDLGEHALGRADALAGRVVSATGAPIAGATVTIVPGAGGPAADPEVSPAPRTVATGADGTFRSAEASAEGNRLVVVARSYGTVSLANVRAGALAHPIALGLGALVSGIVVRADGRTPAPGALVRFEEGSLETPWVEAGVDGRFQMTDLPARAGQVVAEGGAAGLGQAATGPLPPPRGHLVTVVLGPPPSLEGLVLDRRTRAPVARARITVEDGTRTRTARAGPDGRYVVRGLLPQRAYRVRADEPRYTPYVRDRVLLATAETLRLDLPLALGASLSGRVIDEQGKPVAAALGRLLPAGGGGFDRLRSLRAAVRLVFRSAADGTFKATRLPPGEEQRLVVVHPDFEASTTGGLSLAPGQARTVTVTLRRGLAIAGRVRDEAGRPVAGADVQMGGGGGFRGRFGPGGGGTGGVGFTVLAGARPEATTGADGRFEVKGLGAGTYSLTVSRDGFAEQRLDRVTVDAEHHDAVEVTLSAGAAIRGIVSRRDGRAAEGYRVRAMVAEGGESSGFGRFGFGGFGGGFGPGGPGGQGGRGGPGEARVTGADGAFEIAGLRVGETYDLMVVGPDGMGARREGVDAPAEDVEIVVPGPGRISGRVVDAQTSAPVTDFQVDFGPDRSSGRGGFGPGGGAGRMIARVVRAATGDGDAGPQAVHGEDGSFVLEDVPAGTWEVVAQAKGYQTARVGGLSVEEGGTRDGVEVRLTRGSAIRGRVLDGTSGAPVLDASVTVQRGGGGGRALDILMGASDARTNADGQFSIDGVSAGSYTVVAQHPDYAQATTVVEVKDGAASAELRMVPGGTVGGVVLSETSAPLAGASVSLSAGAGGGRGGFGGGGFGGGQSATTDEAGRFRFLHVTAGRYSVSASLRGHQAPGVDVVLQAGETRDNLVVSLASGAHIRGVVANVPASVAGTVRVSASGPDGYSAAATAGGDGTFELTGAPAGPVDLRATAGQPGGTMRSATAQIVIADGQTDAQARIAFEDGFTLTGTVTRGGQALASAMVMASRGGGGGAASARTDGTGAYRLEGLLEGAYTVTAMPPPDTGGAPKSQPVTLSGDATLDIVIPSARVGGTVVEAGTRQPLADAVVQAAGVQGGGRGPRSATSDSNGHFGLEDLDPTPTTVTVRKTGFQLETRQVTPAEGGGDDLVIELRRGSGVGIEARDAAFGVPLRAVQARAMDGAGAIVYQGFVSLDGDGRGEIPSLPPGTYTLALYASGYAPAVLAATAPSPRLLIPFAPGGGVDIHAGPTTLAHGSARAQILTPDGRPYPFAFFAPQGQLTLSKPIARIEDLGPGSYVLQVEGADGRPFEVRAGQIGALALP